MNPKLPKNTPPTISSATSWQRQERSVMWKILLKIKAKNPSSESGFTMFEVLVAIMISSAFILGTLQAITINAVLQVKAERQARANFWIQEDLEFVKSVAAGLKPSNTQYPSTAYLSNKCTVTTFGNDSGQPVSYADTLRYLVANPSIAQGNSALAGNPIDLSAMTATPKTTTSLLQVGGNQSLANKNYRLVRQLTPLDNPKVLKITYIVGEPDDSTSTTNTTKVSSNPQRILARLYAEVIPAGAFECP